MRSRTQSEQFAFCIQKACADGDIQLFLQPKVHLRTEKLIGAEALARWQSSTGEWLTADRFLPYVRTSKVRFRITEYIIKEALATLDVLLSKRVDIPISINLDPQEFLYGFTPELEALIVEKCLTNHLEIEVTESEDFFHHSAMGQKIKAVRKSGIKIALDDYGSGYSNPRALESMQFDVLKLDKSFVPVNNRLRMEQVRHSVQVAHLLKKQLIAEGIETTTDKERLLKMGVEFGQGYLFGRPVSLIDFIEKYGSGEQRKCA